MVGPLTPTMHPPNNPPNIPPTAALIIPAFGPRPDTSPNARASGSAIIATIIPDKISGFTQYY